MASDITLAQLRGFVAVARTLNFRVAAEQLFISQPPLTRRIQTLERAVGARLLDRDRSSVSLTPAGEQFLVEAERLLHMLENAIKSARKTANENPQTVRFAHIESSVDLLPQLLTDLSVRFPDIEVELVKMSSPEAAKELRRNNLDIALLRPPVNDPDIRLTVLRAEALVAALPANHPLDDEVIDLHELANAPFVCYSDDVGQSLQSSIDGACTAAGFTPNIVKRTNNTPLMLGYVSQNIGVALIPHQYASPSAQGVKFAALRDPSARTYVAVAHRVGFFEDFFDSTVEATKRIMSERDH